MEVADAADPSVKKATYCWLADGKKLGVRGYGTAGNHAGGFEYLGSLVYRYDANGELQLESAAFGGGRIVASNGSGGSVYTPNYFITDHLGSTRVVYNPQATTPVDRIIERNDFYPYGSRWEDSRSQISDNRYRFSGKEEQVSGNLPFQDFGARFLTSKKLPLWTGQDLLAERSPSISPYAYCLNGPTNRIDPDGNSSYYYNVVSKEVTYMDDFGGNETQYMHIVTPQEEGGLVFIGTGIVGGADVYVGETNRGWAVSGKNLWQGLSEDYNINSRDYATGGSYEYSLLDLQKRYEILAGGNDNFKKAILQNETMGNAQPIHSIEYAKQYAHKWESNSALWFAAEEGYFSPADAQTVAAEGLKVIQKFTPASRALSIGSRVPISTLNNAATNVNSWNKFLKDTKGTYSGQDWIKKASDDYRRLKQGY